MKWKYVPRKKLMTTIVIITILISILGMNIFILLNKPIIPCSIAANPTVSWNLSLTIIEPGGAGNTVAFGEISNASDGQDIFDIPAPPISPQLPSIAAWFETSFPPPYDKLLHEYKHYPSINASWNLSILWLPAPGNATSTTITINWGSTQLLNNIDHKLFLYEDDTLLMNMLNTTSYSYITNDSIHRFQIISQHQTSNTATEENTILTFTLPLFVIVLFIIITIIFFFIRMKKKPRVIEEHKSYVLKEDTSKTLEKKRAPPLKENRTQKIYITKSKAPKKKSQTSKKKQITSQKKLKGKRSQ